MSQKNTTKKSRTIREKNLMQDSGNSDMKNQNTTRNPCSLQILSYIETNQKLGMENKLVQTNFGLSKKLFKRNDEVDYL